MLTNRSLISLAIALAIGACIGYVDSRPGWDDTGITVAAVFLTAAVIAAASLRVAWLGGLAVGLPVVAMNVVLHGTYEAVVAVAIGLVGSAVGCLVSRATRAQLRVRP